MGDVMHYRPVRGVWRPPQQTAAGKRVQASNRVESRTEYISATFAALSKLLDADEYENMLAQWRLGLREIWLEDGFVMTCFTPAGA
jgi:hypothetical protein